mgnify:CR=1 FL=1
MALWGNNDAKGSGGTVSLDYTTLVVTGSGTTFGQVGAAATGAEPDGFAASVSIKQTTAPTATASPSSALSVITPLASAGNSKVALSESTSAMAWSFST